MTLDHIGYNGQISKRRFDCNRFGMLPLLMVTLFTPTEAFLSGRHLPMIPSRLSSNSQTKISPMNLATTTGLHSYRSPWNKFRKCQRMETVAYLSAVTNDQLPEDDPVPLKDDEEFIKAVVEVKHAALNVTESSVKLTSAIVTKGPGIIGRLLSASVDKEFKYVPPMYPVNLVANRILLTFHFLKFLSERILGEEKKLTFQIGLMHCITKDNVCLPYYFCILRVSHQLSVSGLLPLKLLRGPLE